MFRMYILPYIFGPSLYKDNIYNNANSGVRGAMVMARTRVCVFIWGLGPHETDLLECLRERLDWLVPKDAFWNKKMLEYETASIAHPHSPTHWHTRRHSRGRARLPTTVLL